MLHQQLYPLLVAHTPPFLHELKHFAMAPQATLADYDACVRICYHSILICSVAQYRRAGTQLRPVHEHAVLTLDDTAEVDNGVEEQRDDDDELRVVAESERVSSLRQSRHTVDSLVATMRRMADAMMQQRNADTGNALRQMMRETYPWMVENGEEEAAAARSANVNDGSDDDDVVVLDPVTPRSEQQRTRKQRTPTRATDTDAAGMSSSNSRDSEPLAVDTTSAVPPSSADYPDALASPFARVCTTSSSSPHLAPLVRASPMDIGWLMVMHCFSDQLIADLSREPSPGRIDEVTLDESDDDDETVDNNNMTLDDDIEVLCEMKPRHMRTPPLVDIGDDDDDDEEVEVMLNRRPMLTVLAKEEDSRVIVDHHHSDDDGPTTSQFYEQHFDQPQSQLSLRRSSRLEHRKSATVSANCSPASAKSPRKRDSSRPLSHSPDRKKQKQQWTMKAKKTLMSSMLENRPSRHYPEPVFLILQ